MVLKNIRKDLAFKNVDNIIMIHNSLHTLLDIDEKIVYSFISNFDNGLDIKYIFELMEPKGWHINDLNECVNSLLNLNYIEDISNNADHETIRSDFEEFKKSLFNYSR